MTVGIEAHRSLSDYSLVGEHAALAVEKGLADAKWYASPIPKEKMRELLERRDGPAVRDTLLWFALLLAFGLAGLALWGTWWAIIPFAIYGVALCLLVRLALARIRPRHRVQDRLDEQRALRDCVVHGAAANRSRGAGATPATTATRSSSGATRKSAAPRPVSLSGLVLKIVNIPYLFNYYRNLLIHVTGKMTPDERTYIPTSEFGKVYRRARIYLVIYLAVLGVGDRHAQHPAAAVHRPAQPLRRLAAGRLRHPAARRTGGGRPGSPSEHPHGLPEPHQPLPLLEHGLTTSNITCSRWCRITTWISCTR